MISQVVSDFIKYLSLRHQLTEVVDTAWIARILGGHGGHFSVEDLSSPE